MATSLTQRVTLTGDREMFERASNAHRNLKPFLRQVGVLLMSSAVGRLPNVLSDDPDAVRTGRLGASLTVGGDGSGGNADTAFTVGPRHVEVGTNVPYAAQVQFGGRIDPVPPNKALAIPLPARLKRSKQWPRDLDPGRELLSFVPIRGGSSGNVIGLLVDEEGALGFGAGEALFALATHVEQKARPFLFIGEEDEQVIREELYPAFLQREL